MTDCELCGEDTDNTTEIKLEGARLKVCSSCSEMGEEVGTKSSRNTSSSGNVRTKKHSKVLKNGFGAIIKKARESRDLTQNELAERVSEKKSRISKIEGESLKPDEKLGRRLERELDVEIYTNPQVSSVDTSGGSDDRSATLGDVADIS